MQRWTTSYRFTWTPIVTFARRQLKFLDWIEANLDPVSFYDREGTTGVAILSRDIRLTVSRSGMVLEDGAALEAGVGVLREAVAGALGVLEPKDLRLKSGSVAWSEGLAGLPYNEARAGLSRLMSGIDLSSDVPVPVDISALMDVLTPEYSGQVEWGVVSAEELVDRLARPPIGRIATNRPEASAAAIHPDELPEASVFVDSTFSSLAPENIQDAEGVMNAVADIDSVSNKLATALYAQITKNLRGKQ
ncbi:hypothetical protein [Microbacterium sp. LMC-P-041]|uniref:hypothetical protein n=1 Tax=Microbacterium sp. LMC-P-041 TaxID=3040293 RepID=UPI002554B56F|nr:hypothetical protein [Microbacterium sp. LMC-P-041]